MNTKPFVNPFTISKEAIDTISAQQQQFVAGFRSLKPETQARLMSDVLLADEVALIRNDLSRNEWQEVGLDGIADNYREGDQIGSYRLSFFSQEFADILWRRLAGQVASFSHEHSLGDDGETWVPIGINPLMRCIRYKEGGLLVPHYDGPYSYEDGQRKTQASLVLYLGTTGDIQGGATRFLHDDQMHLAEEECDYSDWTRLASEGDILDFAAPDAGTALLFPHRKLHDSQPLTGNGEKTIIRTDIVCYRVS